MSAVWVGLVYGASAISALLLLYFFHVRSWYWHALSVAVAMTIGLIPMPVRWQGPAIDLAVGFVFLFLMVWGIAAPVFRYLVEPRH